MPWARLDDKFHGHSSTLISGLEANGLFARALSYSADHLTDGVLTNAWLTHQGVSLSRVNGLVDRLEAVGIVRENEGGFVIVDYLHYNPSREKVLLNRAARSRAGKRAAEVRWSNGDAQ